MATSLRQKFISGEKLAGIEEYTYTKNGLHILYIPIRGTDTVTANIVYLVGSRHEERGKTGIAHMLEHMLFKDTRDKYGKRQKPRSDTLGAKGALMNANTWTDRTSYYFVMPSQYLDEMLLAEAERMRGIILTDKEFKPEQQNVLSEYEMYAERPDFMLESAIGAQAFVSHGYGHDTIGWKTDIAGLTCTDLKNFYDTYYWPNNAYLIIAGDVAKDEMFRLVDKNFSYIKKAPHPIPEKSIVEPPQMGTRVVEITRPNPLTLTTLAYRAPGARASEWATARVLLTYLAEGKLSPLYKKLVETHKVSSISPGLMFSYDPHLLSLTATVAKGVAPKDVRTIIQKEIGTLRTKKVSARDLVRVKNKLSADTLFDRDGAHAIARELTEYIAGGDWKHYATILKAMERVTAEDIQAYAQKWLKDEHALVGTFIGTATPS